MDELVNYIKDNSNDIDKIKKLLLVLIFNTIYNKYPFSNTIAILNMLHNDEFNFNFNIMDDINYDKIIPLIQKDDNEIFYGYLMLLNEYEKKKKEINKLIDLFNKYKFRNKYDITIYTIKPYILYILKPYFESHFDDKFIYSLYSPVNNISWQQIHRTEIMNRLENITKLFNRNIIKMCNIKVKHISIINSYSFDELVEYYNLCGENIKNKIKYVCTYLDNYDLLNENIKKLVTYNSNFINNNNDINEVIYHNL
jgi:hypothetical protein